jgi:TolB-like protein
MVSLCTSIVPLFYKMGLKISVKKLAMIMKILFLRYINLNIIMVYPSKQDFKMIRFKIVIFFVCFSFSSGIIFSQNTSAAKPIAAVLDLKAEEVSESEARAITNLLISVIHGTDLVQIIDRNQREEILTEISFSLSGCADDSCALEIGKMLAADILITGSLAKVGSRISIELKALSVEEGSILETTFKLYDSIDEIVNNIDSIGAGLIQNVTGKRAAQREVLEYEDLVTLTVFSNAENASVIINGNPIGRIAGGSITKALNRNIDVIVELEHDDYYPIQEKIFLSEDQSVELIAEPHFPMTGGGKVTLGGGSMLSGYYRFFLIPSMLFIDPGLGFTLQNTNELYLQSSFQLKAGMYFNSENNLLRPYGGLTFMAPFLSYIAQADGTGRIEFFIIEPNYSTTMAFPDSDSWFDILDFGLLFGLDYVLTNILYIGLEMSIFLNTMFQVDDGRQYTAADYFGAPFSELFNLLTYDPVIQFGLNATFFIPPPYKPNHPDSMHIEGSIIKWKNYEYIPGFFDGYTALFDDLAAEPDLADDVRQEIENYKITQSVLGISAIAGGVGFLTFGVISMIQNPDGVAIHLDGSQPIPYTFTGIMLCTGVSIVSLVALFATSLPDNVVNTFNEDLGGER